MLKKIDWDSQIGRRLRLRDLHVFATVVQCGSMAKAGAQLGVSTPTVSEVIAGLEGSLGVRLLDRSPKGVEPTSYGQALLRRTLVVFDELKQGIKDLENLDDPAAGEIRIACPLALASTVIPVIFEGFLKKYPRVVLHFDEVSAAAAVRNLQELRERKYDLVLGFGWSVPVGEWSAEDLRVETLYDEELVIVAGHRSKWARRRRIDLAELVDEPWITQGPQTWNYRILAEACRARNLPLPKGRVVTLSIAVISHFVADGRFVSAMPRSVAYFRALKILPVELPVRPWPVNIAVLKNRTLSPAVERFIEFARDFAQRTARAPVSRQRQAGKRRKMLQEAAQR
jgi:DNA-binding transcriptional LysR family regulator